MCGFVLIIKLLYFTSMMTAAKVAKRRPLTILFDTYKKNLYVSMMEHLRQISCCRHWKWCLDFHILPN